MIKSVLLLVIIYKKELNSNDIYDISKGTTKQDELFDYADIPSYYKTRKKTKSYEKDKDDFEMSL